MKTIFELTIASLKSRYRNTWGGILWVHLNPIIIYAVHCFIFSKILNLKMPNIPLYLLGGVLPWAFFSQTVEASSSVLVTSRELIRSFSISPILLTTVLVIENFLTFLISFFIVAIIIYLFNPFPLNGLILLPTSMFAFFLFTLCISISLSILNVFYRDVRFLTSYLLNVMFYMTPILYPESLIPPHLAWIAKINPIYKVIKPLRSCVYELNTQSSSIDFLYSLIILVFTTIVTFLIWKKHRNELIQNL